MKIVIESKSKVSKNTSPQLKIVIESKSKVSQNTPKWKLSGSPNLRCPRIPPQNENCHRVQIQGVPGTPQNVNCQGVKKPGCPRILTPQMKIVIECKSKVSQNTPPKWKLSKSANLRCPRIPPNEYCQRVQIPVVPEYPPKMKIVIQSKSEVSQNPPLNENCHRVQIQGVPEYPRKWKLS